MSHRNLNEDELAAYLDQHLPSGSDVNSIPDQEADPLVQAAARLSNAPQPKLSATARERIQAQMFAAMPDVTASPAEPPHPKARVIRFPAVLLAAVAAVAVFIVGVVLITRIPEENNAIALQLTETALTSEPTDDIDATRTAEAVIVITDEPTDTPTTSPTEAGMEQATEELPTVVIPTSTDTATNTLVPTATATATVTNTSTPRPTSTPTTEAAIIIEGEVEAIDRNVLTIYGFKIRLDEDDPLLNLISVDDFIRVEGDFISSGGELIVSATLVDLMLTINETVGTGGSGGTNQVDVIINNEEGEVWRDNGRCDNPPPPWAPANGWRRRCEGGNNSNQGRGRGN